ncbi:hypothetical protein CEAn_00076 [Coxiella endosymbiont of Amblyomma nuttalli]|nr:hypothetical protein CEAn_00076 [Coxiella endosymbiont of Amblyomma nuttalli]
MYHSSKKTCTKDTAFLLFTYRNFGFCTCHVIKCTKYLLSINVSMQSGYKFNDQSRSIPVVNAVVVCRHLVDNQIKKINQIEKRKRTVTKNS